jgi:peptidoglycan/LPS O-acetylase OafA/YrhL
VNYRPDIDGLRAIAVLSVILYHADKTMLPGGFVGVDIFFVISGYLISLHIFRDLATGHVSIKEFYRRRIKRIAPPMLLVVALTLFASQQLLRPEDAEAAAESALWSLFSAVNVYFWQSTDLSYFASSANEKPLLHLWSLGVEEQFYILWPLLLMLAYRRSHARGFLIIAAVTSAASFLLGDLYFPTDPSFVYFMLPARGGELLLGAIASLIVLKWGHVALPLGTIRIAAATGFVVLLASLVFTSDEQAFPGWRALPPTLGTTALILSGHFADSGPTRLLRRAPLVWVGLISYSAYLWHWPLMAIYRYGVGEPGTAARIIFIVLTLLLAWLTYLFVEQPARRSRGTATQVLLRQFAVPAGMLALIAALAMKLDGYGIRWHSAAYRQELITLRSTVRPPYSFEHVCQRQRLTAADARNPVCVSGLLRAKTDTVLWGDSNAASYVDMISVLARSAGFSYRNVEVGACPPVFGNPERFVEMRRLADCRASLVIARQVVEAARVVIVSGSWTDYERRSAEFLPAFFDTVRALASDGRLVLILGKAPVIAGYDRLCREKALSFPGRNCWIRAVPLRSDIAAINERLRNFAASTLNVEYFDATSFLCPGGLCSAFGPDGQPIYFDSGHLTVQGSRKLGDQILHGSGIPSPFVHIAQVIGNPS